MTSNALILKPFVLTRIEDLNFGTIIPTGSPEFVTINADTGARTMSNPAMRVAADDGYRAEFGSSGVDNNLVVIELTGPTDLVNGDGKLLKVTKLVLDQNNKILRAADHDQPGILRRYRRRNLYSRQPGRRRLHRRVHPHRDLSIRPKPLPD